MNDEVVKNINNYEDVKLDSLTEQLKSYLRNEITDNVIWKSFFFKMKIIDFSRNILVIYIPLEQEQSLLGLNGFYKEIFDKAIKEIFGTQVFYKLTIKNKTEYQKETEEEQRKINSKVITKEEKKKLSNNFVRNQTFDNYLKDGFNEEVVEICQNLINNPFGLNTLYIFGSSGIGKTHLLHAIGNEFVKAGKKGYYISPNSFTRQISSLLMSNESLKISNLIKFFTELDLVVFDDFQLFGDGQKKQTKNFIYEIIDGRIQSNKLTVVAAELNIHDLENKFDDRLITRLESGLITKIKNPNEKEMYNLLGFVLDLEGFDFHILDENSKQFIVKNHFSSIRALLGAAKRVSFSRNKLINTNYVYDVIQKIFADVVRQQVEINSESIIKAVAKYYRISEKDIYGSSRKKEIVVARHIAIILVNSFLSLSSTEIGKIFNKDHTTILNAIKKINNDVYDKSIQKTIEQLSREIRGLK
ncbi:helix-turn-helix domain-containing protein [Mycoplasma sp. 6243]|uniref:helix-turn-helix domain-containing protein n=1 Tax=Mycoplasma sp. 6243 TaxID=3440865 RepID=UPI003EBDDCB1